jgi:uncharacterized protein (TIGR00375 family)
MSIVSFSDLHSYWPWRIGREATVFDIDLTYDSLVDALKTRNGLVETIEVDPNYGKYHIDGHRNCNVILTPNESKKLKNICPVCRKPLTIGVLHRVEDLADREEGYKPEKPIPYRYIIPLHEILAKILDKGMATKQIWEEYYRILKLGKNEFDILLNASKEDLVKVTNIKIADAIMKNRDGKINVKPGYDGVYGEPYFDIDSNRKKEEKNLIPAIKGSFQKGLNDFI